MAAQKPPAAPETEAPATTSIPKVITMTMDELQTLLRQNAQEILAGIQGLQPAQAAPGIRRPLRNADLQQMGRSPHVQTQEDVNTMATTVGPVTHGADFLPAVPEVIAKRDWDAHGPLIGKLQGMGYIVTLIGVEFDARWEPTEKKLMGEKVVDARIFLKDGSVPPEPPEAAPLLKQLRAIEPQASRIYLQRWVAGKAPSGDRSIDELIAQENRVGELAAFRNQEIETVLKGDFTRLDNTMGETGLGMERQRLAPLEA